jgi:hypothetical protein
MFIDFSFPIPRRTSTGLRASHCKGQKSSPSIRILTEYQSSNKEFFGQKFVAKPIMILTLFKLNPTLADLLKQVNDL